MSFNIENIDKIDLSNYNLDKYLSDIINYGLEKVWKNIINFNFLNKEIPEILSVDNFSELYEIGLGHINKEEKKEMGKYYTPTDVSSLMSKWLKELRGDNICDVACGTGRLILSYLDLIGEEKSIELLKTGKIYLYDIDELALNICKYSIGIKYGMELVGNLHTICDDFLNFELHLPPNCKVISNPPYAKFTQYQLRWEVTDVMLHTKELYSCFIEKIVRESESSVIISPFSFIGSEKFYDLRKVLNDYNGFIISFDNIPGCIFSGRKKGIFNSNVSNSTRAAITVTENKKDKLGYKISPLIRFKSEERDKILNKKYLESLVGSEYQLVDKDNKSYYKCFNELEDIKKRWFENSNLRMKDLISKEKTDYLICIPNSCRYFTVGSSFELDRGGKYTYYVKDKETFDFIYCYMNSSFPYWFWRMYDGGVLYPQQLLLNNPLFFYQFSKDDMRKLGYIADGMRSVEKECIVKKLNAGKEQENIKFPTAYREEINRLFLKVLDSKEDNSILRIIHKNSMFGEIEED